MISETWKAGASSSVRMNREKTTLVVRPRMAGPRAKAWRWYSPSGMMDATVNQRSLAAEMISIVFWAMSESTRSVLASMTMQRTDREALGL